ncbi:uncharacterized protein LOC118145596 [Callithrix jacchus]|uniref:uncharacterized protein LOC118145596 isoform X1 n=1 Tax=Callithrix jacchus TaxID=9483 RepID=UPI00159DD3A6|nr:uncharacterized protein LOC118145596 isoform X1 [Callithrix jacchus]
MGGAGDKRLGGSKLVQTKQSYTHKALQSCRGVPASPTVQPQECTLQRTALPSAHTQTHTRNSCEMSRGLQRRGGTSPHRPSVGKDLTRRPSAWSRRQVGDKPKARAVTAPCGRARGRSGRPCRVPHTHPPPRTPKPPSCALTFLGGGCMMLKGHQPSPTAALARTWRRRAREEGIAQRARVCEEEPKKQDLPRREQAGGRQEDPGQRASVRRRGRSAGKAWGPDCPGSSLGPRCDLILMLLWAEYMASECWELLSVAMGGNSPAQENSSSGREQVASLPEETDAANAAGRANRVVANKFFQQHRAEKIRTWKKKELCILGFTCLKWSFHHAELEVHGAREGQIPHLLWERPGWNHCTLLSHSSLTTVLKRSYQGHFEDAAKL